MKVRRAGSRLGAGGLRPARCRDPRSATTERGLVRLSTGGRRDGVALVWAGGNLAERLAGWIFAVRHGCGASAVRQLGLPVPGSTPAAPRASGIKLFGPRAARPVPLIMRPDGIVTPLQGNLASKNVVSVRCVCNAVTLAKGLVHASDVEPV